MCQCILPIMLALCLMLLVTYYAFYYAGMIGLGLMTALKQPYSLQSAAIFSKVDSLRHYPLHLTLRLAYSCLA